MAIKPFFYVTLLNMLILYAVSTLFTGFQWGQVGWYMILNLFVFGILNNFSERLRTFLTLSGTFWYRWLVNSVLNMGSLLLLDKLFPGLWIEEQQITGGRLVFLTVEPFVLNAFALLVIISILTAGIHVTLNLLRK